MDEVETGNVQTDYGLQILDVNIKNPFFHNKYQDYTETTDTFQLHLTDNFYLPVSLRKITYQEYENVKKTHTEEEIRQIATKNLENYLTDLEEKGIQIIGKNVIIESKGGKYVVKGTIDAYESIVSYQPTEIYNITSEEGQETNESD